MVSALHSALKMRYISEPYLTAKSFAALVSAAEYAFISALPKYASHAANMLNSVLPVSISRGTLLYWVVAKPSLGSTTPSPYR